MSQRMPLGSTRVSSLLRHRQVEVVLFTLAFVVFALTATRAYVCMDVWSSNYASWRVATAHSLDVDGINLPWPAAKGSPLHWVWVHDDAPNGHTVITRAPGVVWAGIPAYLLLWSDSMSLVPGALTAALLSAVAVVLMFRATCALMSRRNATLTALVFAFTTPVWSISANALWPQTITVLAIALVAWTAVHERWWLMGVAGGMLVSARPHAGLIVAIVGLTMAWQARRPGIAVRVAVPGTVTLVLLAGWTERVYGSWNPLVLFGAGSFSQVRQSLFDVPNQLAMWIAPDRGMFVYTPIFLVLLPTLVRVRRQLPTWTAALLVAGLAYTVTTAAIISFYGGDPIYGYRYGLEFLACATPAFAFAATQAGALARRLLTPVLVLQFVVIALGAVLERIALDYRKAWTHNAFVDAVTGAPVLIPICLLVGLLATLAVRRFVPPEGPPTSAPELVESAVS